MHYFQNTGKSELCSISNPIDERGVAADEKRGLLKGIEELEAKISDKRIDPNAKIILQKFLLPDPEKLPEFYRLSEGRLLIIWGCETNRLDLLPAHEAVEKLKVDPGYKVVARRSWPFFKDYLLPLLIFILIALLCYYLANQGCSPEQAKFPFSEKKLSLSSISLQTVTLAVGGKPCL